MFQKKNGKGKIFPGGTTCNFRGKEVPCVVLWSENGSITCEILTDIFRTLYLYELFLRRPGLTPFALMDVHGSIIELPFLEYVNKPETNWACCIDVPYGTSLWKVGDSKEQNGLYKIVSAQIKKELIKKRKDATWNLPWIVMK